LKKNLGPHPLPLIHWKISLLFILLEDGEGSGSIEIINGVAYIMGY
jgi:hypothetical protein